MVRPEEVALIQQFVGDSLSDVRHDAPAKKHRESTRKQVRRLDGAELHSSREGASRVES
jgi:hypothetical protein